LVVDKCHSFRTASDFINRSSFWNRFFSHPNLFVIVLKCDYAGDLSDLSVDKIEKFKRPVIVSFECGEKTRIFFKDHGSGSKCHRYTKSLPSNARGFFDFGALLNTMDNGRHGSFETSLLDAKIEIVSGKSELLNCAASDSDYLSMRFIHLFNNRLRPSEEIMTKLLKQDFTMGNMLGFTTIYDYSFIEAPTDRITGEKSLLKPRNNNNPSGTKFF
jgi:hypothetical protein